MRMETKTKNKYNKIRKKFECEDSIAMVELKEE